MKKIIALFIACSFVHAVGAQLIETTPSSSSGQVLGQVKYADRAKATLTYTVNGSDSTYLLMLYDERPQEKKYFGATFRSENNTLSRLYNLLVSYITERKSAEPRSFKLGDEKIVVQKGVSAAIKTVWLGMDEKRIELRRGELDKLFNIK